MSVVQNPYNDRVSITKRILSTERVEGLSLRVRFFWFPLQRSFALHRCRKWKSIDVVLAINKSAAALQVDHKPRSLLITYRIRMHFYNVLCVSVRARHWLVLQCYCALINVISCMSNHIWDMKNWWKKKKMRGNHHHHLRLMLITHARLTWRHLVLIYCNRLDFLYIQIDP